MGRIGAVTFETKDSGKRVDFASGMRRDTNDDKPRYDLIDVDMLERWAHLMARGAKKYGENNWRRAKSMKELRRFVVSAMRHLYAWVQGNTDEDHAAAVLYNVAGAEMVRAKLARKGKRSWIGK